MNNFEKGVINLVKSSITGESITLPDDFNWENAYKLGVKHQIIPMFYYGIHNSDIVPPSNIAANIEIATYKYISVSTKQLYELEKIFKAFENEKIEYMPLKGSLLKYLYPKSELRSMADADILIKTEQYPIIKRIMQELLYNESEETNHEIKWDKPSALNLELHKRLIPSYNKDYYSYFGDGWQLAHKTQTGRYEMSDEDNFIYLFTHYAKHYRDAGIGIRHLTDFYVFLNAKPNLDKEYIEKELKKLQLLEFYKNSIKTLSVWFDGESDTPITDFMTSKIIGSGSYGLYENKVMSLELKKINSGGNKKNLKIKKICSLVFLPYTDMANKYPVLKKVPIILPIMWIIRVFDVIFRHPDSIKRQSNVLSKINAKNISEYQVELNYVGLDFNFKE